MREKELLYVVENAFLAFIEQIRAVYGGDYGFTKPPCGHLAGKKPEKRVGMNDFIRIFSTFPNDSSGDRKNRK